MSIFSFLLLLFLLFFRRDEKPPPPHRIANNYSGIRHFCRRIKRFDYRPMIDRSTRENRAPTQRLIGWNAVGTVFCTLVTLRGNGGVAERERERESEESQDETHRAFPRNLSPEETIWLAFTPRNYRTCYSFLGREGTRGFLENSSTTSPSADQKINLTNSRRSIHEIPIHPRDSEVCVASSALW